MKTETPATKHEMVGGGGGGRKRKKKRYGGCLEPLVGQYHTEGKNKITNKKKKNDGDA